MYRYEIGQLFEPEFAKPYGRWIETSRHGHNNALKYELPHHMHTNSHHENIDLQPLENMNSLHHPNVGLRALRQNTNPMLYTNMNSQINANRRDFKQDKFDDDDMTSNYSNVTHTIRRNEYESRRSNHSDMKCNDTELLREM